MHVPTFLTLDQVLRIHHFQIEEHGGSEAMLDIGKLESAITQPRQGFGDEYFHKDLAEMAAAYLFHVTQAHAFEDGNKRTGMHAAILFLALNGFDLDIPTDEAEALTLSIAQGVGTKAEAATFFRALIDAQAS